MRERFYGLIVATGAWLALLPAIAAQTARPQVIPNLSGVWDNTHIDVRKGGPSEGPPGGFFGPGDIPLFGFTKEEPAMWPAAAEKYKRARTGVVRGPWDRGIGELDPANSCFPHGAIRLYTIPRPWELRQLPEMALFLYEADHWVRRAYLDGRGHPEGYPITWMGHSIGKYTGDTLVVDTVGMSEKTWLDTMGHPHSDALHVVERFRRLDRDTLQIDLTFDDPQTYTKPWIGKKIFKLAPRGFDILEEVLCEEWLEMGKKR
ncbi:MAG: hypothetical protein A3H28_00340 [Acidobacteria bacterium RIFCSPLOWO2_02_FULL_61_28]|nr:MAG: hypothetical protein A3H28_00340 [Acidobacteria bacterium RIFCSPLOWO2_02_FULL_61_28]